MRQTEISKFVICFLLTVAFRAKSRTTILPDLLMKTKDLITNNIFVSYWLLETFSSMHMIEEFLLDCPVVDMRRFVVGLLRKALRELYLPEQDLIREYMKDQKMLKDWTVVDKENKDRSKDARF